MKEKSAEHGEAWHGRGEESCTEAGAGDGVLLLSLRTRAATGPDAYHTVELKLLRQVQTAQNSTKHPWWVTAQYGTENTAHRVNHAHAQHTQSAWHCDQSSFLEPRLATWQLLATDWRQLATDWRPTGDLQLATNWRPLATAGDHRSPVPMRVSWRPLHLDVLEQQRPARARSSATVRAAAKRSERERERERRRKDVKRARERDAGGLAAARRAGLSLLSAHASLKWRSLLEPA